MKTTSLKVFRQQLFDTFLSWQGLILKARAVWLAVFLIAGKGLSIASSASLPTSPYPQTILDTAFSNILTTAIQTWTKHASYTSYPDQQWLNRYLVRRNFFHQLTEVYFASSTSLREVKGSLQKMSPPEKATRVGIGIAGREGEGWMMIVAFFRPTVSIQPFSSQQKKGGKPVLQGRILPGYQEKSFYLTLPNGEVEKLQDNDKKADSFSVTLPQLAQKGEYTLEVVVNHPVEGPEVGLLIPFYVDASPQRKSIAIFQPSSLTEGEQYLIKMINKARRKLGRKELKPHLLLTQVARAHSLDMVKRSFFAHINPDGLDASKRFQSAGGKAKIGENLAKNSNLASAHESLMSSPGHRANILNRDYTHVGVGLAFDGKSYLVTELFGFFPEKVNLQLLTDKLRLALQSFASESTGRELQNDSLLSGVARENAKENAQKESLATTIRGTHLYTYFLKQGGQYSLISCGVYLAYSPAQMEKTLKEHFPDLAENGYTHLGIGLSQGDYHGVSNTLYATVCFKK